MSSANPRRKTSRIIRTSYFIAGGLLLAGVLFLIFIPSLDGPHSRLYRNEASAASKLHSLSALQKKYASINVGKGFACELPLLKSIEQRNDAEYDPLLFLTTGTQSGYRFRIDSCESNGSGLVVHYRVTAVPIKRGTTGRWIFCIDDTGILRYDDSEVEASCFSSKLVVEWNRGS
jgi:hypothetical protein